MMSLLEKFSKFFADSPYSFLMACLSTIALVVGLALLNTMYITLLERKVVARMQNRFGPNRTGKWGLLQPLADGLKMMGKENLVPENSDKLLRSIAPVLTLVPAVLVVALLPFGKELTPALFDSGVLLFLALSSVSVAATFMAAWSSRSKFASLSGMRAAAQIISYEVPMLIALLPVIMASGSLSLGNIVLSQSHLWNIFTPWGILAASIFFICTIAETNRSPMDLPEAESEIAGGFHLEYSSVGFALFYLAEFMNVFSLSALNVSLFWGGWQGPWLPDWAWFLLKTYLLVGFFFLLRGTLPRLRIDHVMELAWKFLIPLGFANLFITWFWHSSMGWLKIIGSCLFLIIFYKFFEVLNSKFKIEKRTYTLVD